MTPLDETYLFERERQGHATVEGLERELHWSPTIPRGTDLVAENRRIEATLAACRRIAGNPNYAKDLETWKYRLSYASRGEVEGKLMAQSNHPLSPEDQKKPCLKCGHLGLAHSQGNEVAFTGCTALACRCVVMQAAGTPSVTFGPKEPPKP